MSARRIAIVLVAVATACTGEPGGGGVNITETTVGASVSSTTVETTTTAPSTTTTAPTTTTTATTTALQVSGRVTDEDGAPVVRAFVTMGEARAITGPDGWFSLETSSPGAMTVSKPGWSSAELAWEQTTGFFEATITPVTIRGLRVAAGAARDDEVFERLISLADETAVNALVFDTKLEGGRVLYDTSVQAAHDIGAVEVFYDPAERIARAHDHGLYTITRIASFEDATAPTPTPRRT